LRCGAAEPIGRFVVRWIFAAAAKSGQPFRLPFDPAVEAAMIEWKQPAFFIELLVILTGSLASVLVCRRLRVPDIVAYLLAGAVIGPHALGLVKDSENIRFFADFGVAFLLFELGLEFSLPKLFGLRRSVFGLGSLQVLLTTAALAGLLVGIGGYAVIPALVIGGALALSSTAIVVRELRRLKLIHRHHAQMAVGVLIFQDIAAVLLLALVPALGGVDGSPVYVQIGWALGRSLLLGAILLGVAQWVLPWIFREVAKTGAEEVFVLSTLVIVLLSGWLTSLFGLSMAFGAFIIGVMLGESEFRHQVEMDIRPFRDMLMGLFFAGIGMRLDVRLLASDWPVLLAGTALLVLCKGVVATVSALLMGESRYSAGKTGVILAQAGEFGFALIALATEVGILAPAMSSRVLLMALASMVLSPFLIRYSFEITQATAWLFRLKNPPREQEMSHIPEDLSNHVILAGYGRVGQMIAKFLKANGIPFIALDLDSEQIKRGRAAGEPVIYGSCGRIELLKRCHIERARLAILTFKSLKEAQRVIGQIRALGYGLPIIVRTQHHGDCVGLINAGADHVVPEMFESSLLIASEVLAVLGFARDRIERQVADERLRHVGAGFSPRSGTEFIAG
jgi:CPA2 family monovalent cation:H+ antiporter-2